MDAATGYPVNSGVAGCPLATAPGIITAEGRGSLFFTGYMDQTDIFFKMAAALSNDTTDADKNSRKVAKTDDDSEGFYFSDGAAFCSAAFF